MEVGIDLKVKPRKADSSRGETGGLGSTFRVDDEGGAATLRLGRITENRGRRSGQG